MITFCPRCCEWFNEGARCACPPPRPSTFATFAVLVAGSAVGQRRDVPTHHDGVRAAAVLNPKVSA